MHTIAIATAALTALLLAKPVAHATTPRPGAEAARQDTIGPLMGPLLVIPDETWSVTMPEVP